MEIPCIIEFENNIFEPAIFKFDYIGCFTFFSGEKRELCDVRGYTPQKSESNLSKRKFLKLLKSVKC